MDRQLYEAYVEILKEELVPATGCTEPIAVAYAAALARKTLGVIPERTELVVSANIIKNVKSVVVPGTDGLRGLEAAAASGIVAGDAEKELEVIASIDDEGRKAIREYLANAPIEVTGSDSGFVFEIMATVYAAGHSAMCRIAGFHTNVIRIEKDGEVLKDVTILDIAPTIAAIMGIPAAPEWEGKNLAK